MVKKKRGAFSCTVPGCKSDWMVASKRRLQYCNDHHDLALESYVLYKKATKCALETFEVSDINKAIALRREYDREFIGGDTGAHAAFVELLVKLTKIDRVSRKSEFERLLESFKVDYEC
jgi:hypothetical protein